MGNHRSTVVAWLLVTCLCAGAAAACTSPDQRSTRTSDGGSLFVVRGDDVELRQRSAGGFEAEFDSESKVVWFADRPVRHAGTMKLKRLAQEWDQLGFKGDPPNGALEVDRGAAAGIVAVKVSAPRFTSDERLHFRLSPLDGEKLPSGLAEALGSTSKDKPRNLGSASLFIDPSSGAPFFNYPDDRRYTKDGIWAQAKNGVATIGLSDAYLDSAGEMVFAQPTVNQGDDVDAGDPVATLESSNEVGELDSPVTGEVVETNPSLDGGEAQSVNSDPYGSGWFVRIKLDDPAQMDRLLSAADYIATLPDRQKPNAQPLRPANPPTPLETTQPADELQNPTKHLVDFEVVSGTKVNGRVPTVNCRGLGQRLNEGTFVKLTDDLNQGAGGAYIYLCLRWSTSRSDPGIRNLSISGPVLDSNGQPVPGQAPRVRQSDTESCDGTDLNQGAGGDYLYLCMYGVQRSGSGIRDVEVRSYDQRPTDPCPQWTVVGPDRRNPRSIDPHGAIDSVTGDLNQGSGGKWIYLCVLPPDS